MEWELVVILFCLAMSAVFSFSETALTGLGRLELQSMLVKGGANARLLQVWIRDPGKILVTILVGNNIANSACSSVFALWANHNYPNYLTSLVMAFTVILIVVSEIIPKLLARQFGHSFAPLAIRFLGVVQVFLWPVVYLFQKISTGLTFLSGKTGRELRKPISEEELTHTIELAAKDGGIDRETGAALSNLMDFPDRIARDIMTPRARVQALNIRWGQDEVMRFVAADGHSRYPVVREGLDEIVGMLLVKDLLAQVQRPGSWTRAIRRPYYIPELAPLGAVLRDMKRWGTHLALVRNETGMVTGLVTLEDLIEEIVGEIRDEHDDPADAGMEGALGGPVLVSGEMPLLDFNDRFLVKLPHDANYSTLNGYLLSKLGGALPPAGTLIVDEDITFRVHSVSESGIVTLEVIQHARGVE